MGKVGMAMLALVMLSGQSAFAEVLVVNIWQPNPGMGAEAVAIGKDARAIYEKAGAAVTVGTDMAGRMHFAAGFDNWQAWDKAVTKVEAGDEWPALMRRASKNPVMSHHQHYLLNSVEGRVEKPVLSVFIWDALPGKFQQMLDTSLRAREIHTKAGAQVAVMVDQLRRMHYVMGFDSWADWAKFSDKPPKAFRELVMEVEKDPNAKLIENYTINVAQ